MPISKLTSPKTAPAALMAAFLVAASANAKDEASPYQETPERHVFDGETDDLLTAGLGISGLIQQPSTAEAPKLSTWRDQRRRAIHQNWRALVDLRRWT